MTHKNNNIILGLDTSCYTTSIAAITLDKEVILNEKIILKVKKDCKGLRQSEAVFQHVNNMGEISQIISEKLKDYNTAYDKAKAFVEAYPTDVDGKNEYDIVYTSQTESK